MRSIAALLSVLAAVAPSGAQQTPAADSARVYALNEVEVPPQAQNPQDFAGALQEAYPAHLRQAGVGGLVQLAFVVGADGQVGDVRVLSASDSSFAAPSVQAISRLRFSPARVQGRAVAVRVEQPVAWRVQLLPVVAEGAGPRSVTWGDSVNGYELTEVEDLPRIRNPEDFAWELARRYPRRLRNAGVNGVVVVRFRIEPDGSTSSPTVLSASDSAFVEPALRALEVVRFIPARMEGRPVRVWVEQPFQFHAPPRRSALEPAPVLPGRP